jgi:ATP phosphoribosyltransferase
MSTLKIAIQKSGRLNEDSIQILKDCGISINNGIDQLKGSYKLPTRSIIFKKFRYSSIFD